MAVQLGKITREHDLRTVWSNEAQAFTPWLAEHIVWIVKDAREERRAAIEWLNKISDDTIGFFNPLFRRVILLENTNKPARRIFDGQFCGLVSISFGH